MDRCTRPTTNIASRLPRVALTGLAWFACAASLTALGGCYGLGGSMMSVDRGRIDSRANTPKTVSIIDTRTESVVFTIDIPVDSDLLYSFAEGGGDPALGLPDTFAYEVWPRDTGLGSASNKRAVPSADARRLEWKLRPLPELPGTLQPAKPLPTRPAPPVPPAGATD